MTQESLVKYSVITLCGIILSYIIIRIFTVDITYDEYGSYLYLVHMPTLDLFTNRDAWLSANNHVINTICMQFGNAIFGPNLAAMRWGSVVSGEVFLLFGYRFIGLIHPKRNWNFLWLFIILGTNHFGIEFFSLARGYGMVYALSMALLYYYNKLLISRDDKYFIYGSLSVCLGIFINLTTSIIFASWFISTFIIYLFYFKSGFTNYLKKLIRVIPAVLLTMIVFYKPVTILNAQGEFEYGPAKITDTFWSIYSNIISRQNIFKFESVYNFTAYLIAILFLLIFVYSIVKLKNSLSAKAKNLFITSIFLIIIAGVNVILHSVTGANYLTGRTAILYFPFFTGVLVLFLNDLEQKKIQAVLIPLIAVFLLWNSCLKVKLGRCDEWWFDGNSKEFAEVLIKEYSEGKNITVSGDWMLLMSPNFYLKRAGFKNITLINKQIATNQDFAVDKVEIQYLILFKNNIPHLKNNFTILCKGFAADVIRIDK